MEEAAAKPFVEWVPSQYKQPEIHDYRCAKSGPKGYKERNKRKREEELELETQQPEQVAAPMDEDAEHPQEAERNSKRQRGEGATYIPVSGRKWKAPATRAAEVMRPQISSSWEKKQAQRAARAQFLEHKKAAVEAARSKRKAAAMQRKEAAERKKANQQKSEVVQKVTNNATLKKMMKNKKAKKALRKADTN